MKVLIACEFSGVVRDAFLARGHDAWSCDLLPSESETTPCRHYQCDVLDVIGFGWDMMIAFPPCTHLSSSGAVYWKQKKKDGRQQAAIEFVFKLSDCKIPKIAIENPVGILSRVLRKPDQIINPFEFSDPYKKKTCLWLIGLPCLVPTDIVQPIGSWHHGAHYGGRRKDGTRNIRPYQGGGAYTSKDRGRTFSGIAKAMAEQWG